MSKLILHKNNKFKVANINNSVSKTDYVLLMGFNRIMNYEYEVGDFRYIQNDIGCLLFTPKSILELSYMKNDNNFIPTEGCCIVMDKLYIRNVFTPTNIQYNTLLHNTLVDNNAISLLMNNFMNFYNNRDNLEMNNMQHKSFYQDYEYNDIPFSDIKLVNGIELLEIIESVVKK